MRFKLKNLENEIKSILLGIGQEIRVHRLDDNNYIIDIEYDKYTIKIMELFKEYLEH
jgi:hypothetical protein